MSQFNIAMKKNSMRKNKKLVINIASRLESDQNIGSLRDEKNVFESEIREDMFQRFCSKSGDIDGSIDEDEVIRDEIMREVDVGTGLSGALNLLRKQGTFKEESKHEDDRFRDGFKEVRIERVDDCGRLLTQKEAFRSLSHGFHGKKPGKRKQEKWNKKHEDKSKHIESSDKAVERIRQVHAILKSPYIVL